MFESAEIGHRVSKAQFKQEVPALREALLEAQATLFAEKKVPVVLLISGEDGSGKRETISVLYDWMDPRYLSTMAFEAPTDEERERPAMWRYWRSLPPKGRIGIFSGSWYSDPIRMRIEGELTEMELDARSAQINRFEAMLVNEGALVLKFWIHLTQDAQRARFKALESDPTTAWRVTPWHWERLKTYDKLHEVSSHLLRMTNTASAPWVIVEGVDDRYRSLKVGQVVLAALQARLGAKKPAPAAQAPMVRVDTDGRNVLSELDLSLCLPEKNYKAELGRLQGRLSELARDPRLKKHSVVVAFEGADAAGKGGAIRRITAALDARQFQVIPVAAPTEEERAQPHLWRFWRHLPRQNHMTIFDRTWYGRVLVERVEGYCTQADWQRAYSEINDFEHELVEAGVIVVKFWLQISQEEQLRRFKEREQIAFKRFKITEEDWRNRDKWDAYQLAICDMVERTSTGEVPWTLVESNDKNYARVKILQTLCDALESALEGKGGKVSGVRKARRRSKTAARLAGMASSTPKAEKSAKPKPRAADQAVPQPLPELQARPARPPAASPKARPSAKAKTKATAKPGKA